ncbi:unnamed protein product [Caenorhabditis auriculariae]|uniref:Uncharacterized protein n=1 Tax=Caenorhabditis auriculariae TaxID=2777116 RepID=A0A8S1GXZ6_9PELO|nr:unnamed protein product [Caenorhabditis auriculariae]
MGAACSCEQDSDDSVVVGKDSSKKSDIIHFFMLGIEGAGKTTIIRQLKCLCTQKPNNYQMYDENWKLVPTEKVFASSELDDLKKVVRINLIIALASLAERTMVRGAIIQNKAAMEKIMSKSEEIHHSGKDIYDFHNRIETVFGDHIVELLADPEIAKTLEHMNSTVGLKVEDGTLYFIKESSKILNIFNDAYQLSPDDIVHVRKPTVTFKSYRFRIKQLRVEIHDMGGQKTELVKVPEFMKQFLTSDGHCFLLYVSSMAGFHEPDKENRDKTVLDKSLKIMDIVLTLDGVDECSLMLFINKQDRFEEIVREKSRTVEGQEEINRLLGKYVREGKKQKSENFEHLKDAVATRFKEVIKPRRKGNSSKGYYIK